MSAHETSFTSSLLSYGMFVFLFWLWVLTGLWISADGQVTASGLSAENTGVSDSRFRGIVVEIHVYIMYIKGSEGLDDSI
ncbi:MAG: hypothetical protein H0T78_07970 [Longispora sp.]|nr:hypothetical protein [Longispora sp. (in: high G+C Gram-positive bacteria)]